MSIVSSIEKMERAKTTQSQLRGAILKQLQALESGSLKDLSLSVCLGARLNSFLF